MGTEPRVLVLAESLPWPPVKGGDLRTWQNLNALARIADVGVFGLCSNDSRRDRPPPLALSFWKTSTDPALASPPPTGIRIGARAWLLDPAGHPSDLFFSDHAASELKAILVEFQPQLVLLEGLWLQRYLPVLRPFGCTTILDCHNVEAVLAEQVASGCDGRGLDDRVVRDVIPRRTAAIEANAVDAVDQLWVCSELDATRIRARYRPRVPILVIPNTVSLEAYPLSHDSGSPSADGLLRLVYTGFFAFRPNAVAARFLVDEVFPRLSQACDGCCRLNIVGAMPGEDVRAAAARDSRITVTGAVQDVRPYLQQATVMPIPLFQGSGTRLKVLEAFATGLPVVSTSIGVEGLAVRPGEHVLIADTADEFVRQLLEIWRDPALARHLASNARSLVADRYSWDALAPLVGAAVESSNAARTVA